MAGRRRGYPSLVAVKFSPSPPARSLERVVSVPEEVPDLLADVPATERAAAAADLRARSLLIPPGPLADGAWPAIAQPAFGLLVLRGHLLRELPAGQRNALELIGPGDLLRPWEEPALSEQLPPRWRALEDCALAILDRRFAERAGRWPAFTAALIGRAMARERRAAMLLALRMLPRVEDRLRGVLWALADRLGRVTPYGVEVRIALRQADLAALAGARRPTVNVTLRALREEGTLRRWDGEGFVLDPDTGALVAAGLGAVPSAA